MGGDDSYVGGMSEHDRLAALLERATQERRGSEIEGANGTGRGEEESELPLVVGGEWLPEEPAAGRHRAAADGPRVLTMPESLRSVNLAVRPIAVLATLVVVLVAAAVFGVRWWQAEQGGRPVPVAPAAATAQSVAAGPTPSDTADGVATSGAPPTGTPLSGAAATGSAPVPAPYLVHVAGQVAHPGVVQLVAGDRVQDAVDAAGGLTEQADTTRLNLAAPVADGERVWVPRPGEEVPEVSDPGGANAGAGASAGAGGAGGGVGGAGGAETTQINLNTADQVALEELPGVGPVTAGAIVTWRTEHGQFTSVEELLEVSGIGEATLEKLRPHVTL